MPLLFYDLKRLFPDLIISPDPGAYAFPADISQIKGNLWINPRQKKCIF